MGIERNRKPNPMLMESSNYREFLNAVFIDRKSKNKFYSLRAFAKSLEVSHSHLYGILQGLKTLTPIRAKKFLSKLNLETSEGQVFIELVKSSLRVPAPTPTQLRFSQSLIPREKNSVFSAWYHWVILELAHLPSFQLTSSTAAKAIGILEETAEASIASLLKLGFLEKTSNGSFRRTKLPFTQSFTEDEMAMRFIEQLLELAKYSIRNFQSSERVMSAEIFPLNRDQFVLLQKQLQVMIREAVSKTVESSDSVEYDSVFLISAQMVQLASF